jgi:hypothetical protein
MLEITRKLGLGGVVGLVHFPLVDAGGEVGRELDE